ncbi:MAG: hypothetical protein Q8Q04_01950 [archaeon]|nr:hypothetical protein [archaeon]
MNGEDEFFLSDSVRVYLKSEKNKLEELVVLAKSKDVSNEIGIMKKMGDFPPFTMLVYENFLGWSNFHRKDESIILTLTDYSDKMFEAWVDCSFSFNKSPIRIIKKMSSFEEFYRRINLRTSFDWVEYDYKTQVMRENMKKTCSVKKYLDLNLSYSPEKEVYSLTDFQDGVRVNLLMINEDKNGPEGKRLFSCEGNQEMYSLSLGAVEEMILSRNPDAIIVREPFFCCSGSIIKIPSCVQNVFLKAYLEKLGLKMPEKGESRIDLISPN